MRKTRNKERGNIVIVAMLILVALISLGGLTTLSVQGGIAGSGHDRFRSIALYAAESGAAVGMDYLRKNIHDTDKWSALVVANNNEASLLAPGEIAGNEVRPGASGSLFSTDIRAWFKVEILNNLDDTGFAAGNDTDGRVILRSTGYGPNGTVARVEWTVSQSGVIGLGRPCPSYAQGGIDADGAGLNDCMGTITNTQTSFSINP